MGWRRVRGVVRSVVDISIPWQVSGVAEKIVRGTYPG